jgi:sulfur-oxidizing protein SoxY
MPIISRRHTLLLGLAFTFANYNLSEAFANDEAAAEIAKFTGGQRPEQGKISLDLPDIAENGNSVPLTVRADSPMTASDYITDVLVVADRNPRPIVAIFQFTPLTGRAEAATRIRLVATQNIVAIAKTNTGALFAGQKLVKVTIGGCGG